MKARLQSTAEGFADSRSRSRRLTFRRRKPRPASSRDGRPPKIVNEAMSREAPFQRIADVQIAGLRRSLPSEIGRSRSDGIGKWERRSDYRCNRQNSTRCGYWMPIHFNGRFQRSDGRSLLRDGGQVHKRSRIAGRGCSATWRGYQLSEKTKGSRPILPTFGGYLERGIPCRLNCWI
jgi:hypothetical protein